MEEGSTPCFSLALTISNGKTNKWCKKQYGAAMRHTNPLLCFLGALAQYLFFRWHCSGEKPPTFQTREAWYETKLLVAADPKAEMSWKRQYDDIVQVFGELGIKTDSITHALRKGGPQSAEMHGVSEKQIGRAGRWEHSVMTNAYLSSLPIKFLRKIAGFSVQGGDYFLGRARITPPMALQLQIFPWLERWELKFRGQARRLDFAGGGLDRADIAGGKYDSEKRERSRSRSPQRERRDYDDRR
jgi:hypothetical protein